MVFIFLSNWKSPVQLILQMNQGRLPPPLITTKENSLTLFHLNELYLTNDINTFLETVMLHICKAEQLSTIVWDEPR